MESLNQRPYRREIWSLGPPQRAGYPGAFPRGLITRLRNRNWWGDRRAWLFSGSFKDGGGITVDLKRGLDPTVVCNCEQLPFRDEFFDFVMLDPPYSKEEASNLYSLPYCNMVKVMNEAARICASGGLVLLLHRMIPWHHPEETPHKKRLKIVAVIGVFTIAGYTNMRALSVWRKQDTLVPYLVGSQ